MLQILNFFERDIMRKYLVLCCCYLLIISCSNNEEAIEETSSQIWQLVKMTGNVEGSETTGTAMEWQEFYMLKFDGTFLKSRYRNDVNTEVKGSYSYKTINEQEFIVFTYFEENELIANCTSTLEEYLLVQDYKLIGTWNACDGPALEYQKQALCGTK